jgi:hypothetical protein
MITEQEIRYAITAIGKTWATERDLTLYLKRGLSPVRQACSDLEAVGVLRRRLIDGYTAFALAAPGTVQKPVEDVVAADDVAQAMTLAAAEALWVRRMGKKRWRDDPRSLAETQRFPEIYRPSSSQLFTLGGVSTNWGG